MALADTNDVVRPVRISRRSMMKGLAGLALAGTYAMQSGLVSPAAARSTDSLIVNTSGVRLRSGAGTSYGIVATLAKGTEVRYLADGGTANGYRWYKVLVLATGKQGYVATNFLSAPDGTSAPVIIGTMSFGLSAELASELGAQADVLARALAPETVRVITVGGADATIDDTRGDLASALGARVGEIFVIRPDGLVLCRISDPAQLGDVAKHLTAGTAPTHFDAATTVTTVAVGDEARRENVWLALSNALDQAEPADREGMLVRLAMILGSQASTADFDSALGSASR